MRMESAGVSDVADFGSLLPPVGSGQLGNQATGSDTGLLRAPAQLHPFKEPIPL